MLKIRQEQMDVLASVQLRRFEQEAIAHIHEFWSDQAKGQGDEGVRALVDHAMQRTDAYSIEEEVDVLRYINLMYSLGAEFDIDLPWAAEILASEDRSGTLRVDELCDRAVKLLDAAESGP